MTKKLTISLAFILLCACSQPNYYVGLYKDKIEKDCLIAVFPSVELEAAMDNCESTVDLYRADDAKNGVTSLVTGLQPAYFCKQVSTE